MFVSWASILQAVHVIVCELDKPDEDWKNVSEKKNWPQSLIHEMTLDICCHIQNYIQVLE